MIIVIGILATLILLGYNNISSGAKISSLKADLVQASKQLNLDRERQYGGISFPASLANANSGAGLSAGTSNAFIYDVTGGAPTTYCLANTNGSSTYYITSASPVPISGGCPVVSGLAGWWKFNGDLSDSSGNLNAATNNGATATTGQSGLANGAYNFNGTSAYLQLPASSVLNPTDNFTVSAWINLSSNIGTSIWNHVLAGGNNDWGFGINVDGSGNGSERLTKVGTQDFSSDTAIISKQVWHLVSMTYSGGTVKYYLDGTLSSTTTNASNPFTAPGVKRIGNGGAYSAFFHGTLDDVRLYSRVLSGPEVSSVYAAGAQ